MAQPQSGAHNDGTAAPRRYTRWVILGVGSFLCSFLCLGILGEVRKDSARKFESLRSKSRQFLERRVSEGEFLGNYAGYHVGDDLRDEIRVMLSCWLLTKNEKETLHELFEGVENDPYTKYWENRSGFAEKRRPAGAQHPNAAVNGSPKIAGLAQVILQGWPGKSAKQLESITAYATYLLAAKAAPTPTEVRTLVFIEITKTSVGEYNLGGKAFEYRCIVNCVDQSTHRSLGRIELESRDSESFTFPREGPGGEYKLQGELFAAIRRLATTQ